MHKATIEKLAKQKESTLAYGQVDTDNKTVIRALARVKAVEEIYPDMTEDARLAGLHDIFYKDAKWQKSWEEPLKKHAPKFADMLQSKLGVPSPRLRKKVAPPVPLPGVEDPEAILTAKNA